MMYSDEIMQTDYDSDRLKTSRKTRLNVLVR